MQKSKTPPLLTLLLLMPFAAVSAVLFTPALPLIATSFQISEAAAALSVTLFLFGYTFGNLLYGPVAKRYGRKPAIYLGVGLHLLGLALILFPLQEPSWSLFLTGRFISALGSSVGLKIAFTLISDSFSGTKAVQVTSLAITSFAIGPGVATALGGFLTQYFGWQSCFYALIAYSLLLLVLGFALPETAPSLDATALQLPKIARSYAKICKTSSLVFCALIMGSSASIIYLFSTFAPFIAMSGMGIKPEIYGLLAATAPAGLILGSFATHFLSTRMPLFPAMRLGIKISSIAALCMLLLFATGYTSPWTLFFPMPFLYFGMSIFYNNASVLAMQHIEDKSNGAAMMSFLNMAFVTTSVLIASSLPHSATLLPCYFLLLCIIAYLLQIRVQRKYG